MRHLLITVMILGALAASAGALAQPAPPSPPPAPDSTQDARETRNQLRHVLDQLPPSVREVLRLDPTLLQREDYLSTYPALSAFLQRHPEIMRNPSFFIGDAPASQPESPELEAARALRQFAQGLIPVLLMAIFTAGTLWLVRQVIDHRRWNRALKAQMELHNKLIDRFAGSGDLLAYLQSTEGKALIAAPDWSASPRPADAPLGRILWSVQAGAVLSCGGAGLLFVGSGGGGTMMYVAPAISAVGTIVLTVGIGFLISAAAAFALSQKLGLVQRA